MKKLFYIVAINILFVSNLFAQNCKDEPSLKTIIYDFKNKTKPKCTLNAIKEGDFYQIEIKGINTNLFKVIINSKDSVLSKKLETPTFGNFDIDILTKVVAGLSPFNITATKELTRNLFQNDRKKSSIYRNDFLVILPKKWKWIKIIYLNLRNQLIVFILK